MIEIISIICIILLIFIALAFLISMLENRRYKINKIEVPMLKENGRIKIAYMSDLHCNVFGKDNEGLVRDIKALEADAVILGGDMIVGSLYSDKTAAISLIRRLAELCPVYYALGNHERRIIDDLEMGKVKIDPDRAYTWERCLDLLALEQIHIIDNKSEVLTIGDNSIIIAGLDIGGNYYKRLSDSRVTAEYIEEHLGPKKDEPTILVAHNPEFQEAYAGWGAELCLSGHYHGGLVRLPGQIGLITPRLKIFVRGISGLSQKGKTTLYTSNGLGSHSIKLRINNVPELVLFTLVPKQ